VDPRDRAQEKLYPIDPLIARLPHLRQATRADIDPTVLAEAQIGTALRRAALRERSTWDSDSALFHLRTATRKEIDFVAAELFGAAIEGKYTDGGSWKSEARTVDASSYRGILTTRSVLDISAADDEAWAVPAALLAALVDS
jgi:predicted AAA+ superfamily ATPase